jgi:prepilin signal peptidase PulO-like enzyme (type II secretory pathway)
MEQAARRRATMSAGSTALALAALATACLAIADLTWRFGDAEDLTVVGAVAGWMLLFWAIVLSVVAAVALVSPRDPSPRVRDGVPLVAAIALIATTISLYPPWGSGAG